MADDVAGEGVALGPLVGADDDTDDVTVVDGLLLDEAERPHRSVDGDAARLLDRGVQVEQVGLATLGPGQRGLDEGPEQRGRARRAALQLRVRLRADPERVALQLAELDRKSTRLNSSH